MSRSVTDLTAEARDKWDAMHARLQSVGVSLTLLYTLRATDEQVALYAQGRKPLDEVNRLRKIAGLWLIGAAENKNIVTNCDGIKIKSRHQTGEAFDCWFARADGSADWSIHDPVRILSLGAIGESLGLVWGGRFEPLDKNGIGWDPDHFELPPKK